MTNYQADIPMKEYSALNWFKFFLPSLAGIIIFMVPVTIEGKSTIIVSVMKDKLLDLLGGAVPGVVFIIILLSAVISFLARFFRPKVLMRYLWLKELFDISLGWLVVRILGAAFSFMALFQVGPEFIRSSTTGGFIYIELLPGLLAMFVFAGLLLPLLLNFGLLELFGSLMTPIMRPLFGVPGRASVDSATSWLGDGSVGVLLTSKQYVENFYTGREAVIVACCFSAVSITFCLIVLDQVHLSHLFGHFYLTTCLTSLVAAIVLPRIPPISRVTNCYHDGARYDAVSESFISKGSPLKKGVARALARAELISSPVPVIQDGVRNVVEMCLGVLPNVMMIGTAAMIVSEYTPVFSLLGMPFIPLLEILNLPFSQAASETLLVGFADMFVPSILAGAIDSEQTRFVIAVVSVTQLIYLSEVGAVILASRIPINILQLFIIFLLRTFISLPIVVLISHILF